MFHNTRKKIVLSIISILLLFLAVTLLAIYVMNCYSLKRQNTEMLDRYVALYSLEALPGDTPPELPFLPDAAEPDSPVGTIYQLSAFYSAAMGDSGEVLAVDTGRNGMYQESDIIETARDILAENRKSGMFQNMMYKTEQRDGYTLIAFMDTTVTDRSLKLLLVNTFSIGLIAVVLLSVLSAFLAKRIVRPLEENDLRQKRFISDAGHELKTPVSVVAANAELLSRQIGQNQWLSNIQYENERMENLVRELLILSRAENGKAKHEELDLSLLTRQEVLPFESVAFEKGLVLVSRISDNIRIRGIRSQIGQLVSILVDNAISYSKGGEVAVILEKVHRQAVLKVENTGDEIPEDVRERLFDRFYRSDESRGGSGGHFGLGLSIAKAVTDEHRGKIGVSCRDGKVIFTVTLPSEK